VCAVVATSACVAERRDDPGIIREELCGDCSDVVMHRSTSKTDT